MLTFQSDSNSKGSGAYTSHSVTFLPPNKLHIPTSPLRSVNICSLEVRIKKVIMTRSFSLFFNLGKVHKESITSTITCARSLHFPGPALCG